ncbi:hypothetical protein D3C71_2133320 [compost metagenome]
MIEDKLHRHGSGEWRIPERLVITQLQPGRPIGQGATVAAHRIGRGAGRDKCGRRFLGVEREDMRVEGRFVDQR